MISNDELKAIYRRSVAKIYRFFYYKFLSKEIAEDLTSETFMQFVDATKKGKNIDNYEAFIWGIAKNLFLKRLRAKYKEEISIDLEVLDLIKPEEFVESIEKEEKKESLILKLIKHIPKKQADLIKLMVKENLNVNQVAERIGKDINYVRTTQNRAIKSLREILVKSKTI